MADTRTPPRTFYLNETHELTRGIKEGAGRLPNLAPIDWVKRAPQIHSSLDATVKRVAASRDPLREMRLFMVAAPEKHVTKRSTAKNKPATFTEETRYAGEHSRVFRRLGLDLLHVADDGTAIVHATRDRVQQLARTAQQLPRAGAREQARWVTISEFMPVPETYRIDMQWAMQIPQSKLADTIVELQPMLTAIEADEVMRALLSLLSKASGELLQAAGTDFSGRHWYRGKIGRRSLISIAKQLYSVESLHRPIPTEVAAGTRGALRKSTRAPEVRTPQEPIDNLPVVGVVDLGVPKSHPELAAYSRGQYVDGNSEGVLGDHGSSVASRVVFGDLDFSHGVEARPAGTCRFLDVVVSEDAHHANTKSIITAIEASANAYGDVRVFNLSFGRYTPLALHSEVERREILIALRDLDNLIFGRDLLVIVAAGNSPPGVQPATAYPDHVDDPQWALGPWTMGFNTLTCGSAVGRPSPSGLARQVEWPSPFTRIGPGVANAPVPEFCAAGGDCNAQYQYAPTLGVWVCRGDGTWEDRRGSTRHLICGTAPRTRGGVRAPPLGERVRADGTALRRHRKGVPRSHSPNSRCICASNGTRGTRAWSRFRERREARAATAAKRCDGLAGHPRIRQGRRESAAADTARLVGASTGPTSSIGVFLGSTRS